MLPPINCATSGLVPFTSQSEIEWNLSTLKHLYRRTTLGAYYQDHLDALSSDPSSLVDSILNEAMTAPLSPEPVWAFWSIDDYGADVSTEVGQQTLEWAIHWIKSLYEGGLRDKLTFFWHNHFVTRLDDYQCPSYLYQYHKLLETYALGNFKDFVYEIGITPAMLIFLNGVQNTKFEPNENYARELLELFTLGVDNGYTQNDIEEAARILTGWNGFTTACNPITFRPEFHDDGEKTIFGKTGNWNYDDLINLLFEERGMAIAKNICEKLYAYFVNPKISEEVVDQLATLFVANDYELFPVISTLLKSEHFFDQANLETIIPGHIELYLTHCRELNLMLNDEIYLAIGVNASDLGQRIFNPVDVAGWGGNREWINTNSFITRWRGLINITGLAFTVQPEAIRTFALNITNESNDPDFICKTIVDYFIVRGLPSEEEYERAVMRFKAEIPQNYFDDGSWNLNWDTAPGQITLLINYIVTLPEFQLK